MQRRQAFQYSIPCTVSQAVIHLFEEIDIHDQKGQGMIMSMG